MCGEIFGLFLFMVGIIGIIALGMVLSPALIVVSNTFAKWVERKLNGRK